MTFDEVRFLVSGAIYLVAMLVVFFAKDVGLKVEAATVAIVTLLQLQFMKA